MQRVFRDDVKGNMILLFNGKAAKTLSVTGQRVSPLPLFSHKTTARVILRSLYDRIIKSRTRLVKINFNKSFGINLFV
jgi:hypothetical protein